MSIAEIAIAPADGLARFRRSLRAELRKVRTTRGTQWALGIIGVLWALVGAGVATVSLLGGAHAVSVSGTLLGMGSAVVVFIPVLGILIMAGDWQSRDVVTVFALEPRRHIVFWAKAATSVILGLVLVVAAGTAAVASAALIALFGGVGLAWDLNAEATSELLWTAGVGIVSGIAYGAALLRVALAVVFSLVQGFVIDPLLALVSHDIGSWFRLGAISDFGSTGGPLGQALVATVLWLALPLAIGFLRNQRSDVQ